MSSYDYSQVFDRYKDDNGTIFFVPINNIILPQDRSIDIYEDQYIDTDTPWTVLSWKIYGTIDYWWILSQLNKDTNSHFYAKVGSTVTIIKPSRIGDVINSLKNYG